MRLLAEFGGKEGRQVVLTFRLLVVEKLKEATDGRSVSEEMRVRLEASFRESIDPATIAALGRLAAPVAAETETSRSGAK